MLIHYFISKGMSSPDSAFFPLSTSPPTLSLFPLSPFFLFKKKKNYSHDSLYATRTTFGNPRWPFSRINFSFLSFWLHVVFHRSLTWRPLWSRDTFTHADRCFFKSWQLAIATFCFFEISFRRLRFLFILPSRTCQNFNWSLIKAFEFVSQVSRRRYFVQS